jgi:hypothetical protein
MIAVSQAVLQMLLSPSSEKPWVWNAIAAIGLIFGGNAIAQLSCVQSSKTSPGT